MTPVSLAPVAPFAFKKNLPLLNQNGSVGFAVTGDLGPDVLSALSSETSLFPARDIDLAEVSLTTSTAAPIEFARGTDKVSFAASAGAFAGLGVYRSGARLLAKLGDSSEDFDLTGLEFGDGSALLSVLRWGYSAEAKGTGGVALGAVGTATAAVAGSGKGLFAVVRRLPPNTPARRVIQITADSWLMPRQIASIDQVEPGTWIVAEVMGSIRIKVQAQVGFDFNWVRAARLGGLTGDLGLRLQAGINATVGFSTSGRSAVIISRDSDAKALRLRILRLRTRQLDASLNATLDVQAVDTLLPDSVDAFIAAVFDTHGQQILRDLKVLERWTDPKKSLAELLAGAGVDGAERLVAHLAGVTPAQLQAGFDAVHAKAVSFIDQWHRLPHTVASAILKMVEDKVDLSVVRDVARTLSTATDKDLRSLLDTQLNRIDFFHTPAGRLLEAVADDGVLSLLGTPLEQLRGVGAQVLAVLDGSTIEATLVKFQSFIESELRLDRVLAVVSDTDFAHLDALLKRKLATFLGQDTIVLRDLDKVRRVVRLLLDKRQEYYEKALEALHRKYNFDLNAAYTAKSTDQALFDASFDFSHDPAAVATFFQQAVQGKLDDLLSKQPPQVSLASGKLSHGVKRQTQVDVSLPFVDMSEVHLNEAVASLDAVPNGGGLLFKLKATDTVASNQRKSVLSLAMGLSTGDAGGSLRRHRDSLEMNYTLLFARRNMQVKHVRAQIEPAVSAFFGTRIPDPEEFLRVLDRQAEEVIPNGPNLLGNGLISLQVSVSAAAAKRAGQAWMSLPADRRSDVYQQMSNAIQSSLKGTVHAGVFSGPDAYTSAISSALTVLAYCAIVPRATKAVSRFDLPFWDFEDAAEVRKMLTKKQTIARMTELLTQAQAALFGDSDADFFRPAAAAAILGRITPSNALLHSLLLAEADVVRHAFEAGVAIASAREAKPSEALKALAKFGSRLTEAFNADVTALLGPGIQALGTKVFLDASRALDEARSGDMAETSAMLNIEFLRPDSAFDADALLKAGRVPANAIAFADRIVELPARS